MDIDTPVLQEIKRLQKTAGKSLGRFVSDLLSEALAARRQDPTPRQLEWTVQDMRGLVDIRDKEALHAALEHQES